MKYYSNGGFPIAMLVYQRIIFRTLLLSFVHFRYESIASVTQSHLAKKRTVASFAESPTGVGHQGG